MCEIDFGSCYLIPISSITIIKPHCNDLCEQIVLHTELPAILPDKGNGLDIYIDCAIGHSEQYVKEVFPNIRHVEIIQK